MRRYRGIRFDLEAKLERTISLINDASYQNEKEADSLKEAYKTIKEYIHANSGLPNVAFSAIQNIEEALGKVLNAKTALIRARGNLKNL